MKLAFIFMFILNATFFSWHYYSAQNDEPEMKTMKAREDGTFESIALLHEAGQFVQPEQKMTPKEVESISERIGQATEQKKEIIKSEIVKCYRLGPFRQREQASEAMLRARGKGAVVSLHTEDKKERFRYWVLDPTGSFNAAKRKIKKYREKGIEDVFLIREGKKKDNISLGIFRARATAQKQLAKLKELGFSPVVEKHYKIRTVYWLNIGETLSKPFTDSTWDAISNGFEGVSPVDEVC